MCFEWDKHEVLFTAVNLLTTRMESYGFHNKFIKTMYIESLQKVQLHFSLRLQAQYESTILSNTNTVLPVLIRSLEDPFFMDIKLSMLRMFLPRLKFLHADSLISRFVDVVDKARHMKGIFVCNINPFMVATAILSISEEIK